ncbi:ABC transporter ATP-binding protein uup [Rosistilla ulvae]|uniref:ATP-binding protein Uup n=1 Tax=Rosistilla ulvae TaxID=1930277 RepID=A0A517M5W1_9BACT|nr:ATP-binding cassette domain-containing protein [Rosistilla ulvae]QDS90264.1 ABC transporter ATP-binding protein uup [Rosistilla ulvae]
MALISLQNITIGFRGPSLLDDVNCQIEAGGRIGLLGRNGAGKSTLLKMLRGGVLPDHGSIILSPGTRVAYLQQDVPSGTSETVAEVTAKGLGEEFHLQENAWEAEHLVEQTLSRMELDGESLFETLSSGMKRRVLLAQAIVSKPQLLLLDEPTNHLDIEAIGWLEGFLAKWPGTLIFVTHDRMFLRKVATRILEIDRGQLFDWSCDYDTFLRRKEEALAAQEKQDALFDKKLAQEEVWIRQGIKARRTRNEGRVRALEKLRETRSQRRGATGTVQMQVQAAERSGNLVTEVKDVSFEYPDRPILKNFSTSIMRGDKIGIIGPNGVGKTTMLKILLGQLEPQSGTVRTGTNLQIAYFDQLRDQLDEEETIQENVGLGHTQIVINGREKHIIGYLQDFLFSPERARTQVKFLSGGERNRVLLARLFANPANVIVLDEPTNDLDAETLEMLEDKLVGYDGTLLLVSHDRAFLNNVVTSTIVYEPDGVKEYVGGYDDWLAQRGPLPTATTESSSAGGSKSKSKGKAKADPEPAKKRLSYKQQRELDGLPAKIETLEGQIAEVHQTIADPSFYQGPGERIAQEQRKLKDLEQKLADTYARWEELEGT